jgi:hypothetical protein
VAIEIQRDGRTMYGRICPPLRVTKWPAGVFTTNVHLQLFLNREQRMVEGVGRYEASDDGSPRQHIPPVILTGVEVPSEEPTMAEACAAIAKLEGFSVPSPT